MKKKKTGLRAGTLKTRKKALKRRINDRNTVQRYLPPFHRLAREHITSLSNTKGDVAAQNYIDALDSHIENKTRNLAIDSLGVTDPNARRRIRNKHRRLRERANQLEAYGRNSAFREDGEFIDRFRNLRDEVGGIWNLRKFNKNMARFRKEMRSNAVLATGMAVESELMDGNQEGPDLKDIPKERLHRFKSELFQRLFRSEIIRSGAYEFVDVTDGENE